MSDTHKTDEHEKLPERISTTTKKKLFVEAMRYTAGIIAPALEMVDITRPTYRNWMKTDPDFAEQINDVVNMQHDFAESKLLEKVAAGSEPSIHFYLDRRVPAYARKTFHDVTSKGQQIETPPIMFVPATTESKDDATETD